MENKIRSLRQAKGWTMRQLADAMSTADSPVHFTTVQKLERSTRRLTHEWAQRIAEALGVTITQVMGEDQAVSSGPALRMTPVIGLVSAGAWREAIQHPDDEIAVPATSPNTFALKVHGDSMDKVAAEGDYVIVDPDKLGLLDGHLYVVRNDEGEATFKRYRANPARLEPCSNNPAHQTIMLGQANFSVIGKVDGLYRSYL